MCQEQGRKKWDPGVWLHRESCWPLESCRRKVNIDLFKSENIQSTLALESTEIFFNFSSGYEGDGSIPGDTAAVYGLMALLLPGSYLCFYTTTITQWAQTNVSIAAQKEMKTSSLLAVSFGRPHCQLKGGSVVQDLWGWDWTPVSTDIHRTFKISSKNIL